MLSSYPTLEVIASICFGLAVLHTFSVKAFQRMAARFPEGSIGENSLHLLGEVEIVFGLWAAVYLACFTALAGIPPAIAYLESLNFTEPAFVFVIMVVCATRPILSVAGRAMEAAAALLPFTR